MSPCLIWWIARRDHELCPGYKERTPARSFSSARQCTRVGFGTACMTLTFRVNQTWYSQNTVRCASCMDASGTGTPVADSPLPHRHVRNTGRRSSKVTSSAISRAGRSFWSLDGGLRSSGNARCAIIVEKRQQAKSISGCGGRSSNTRLAFEARERPTGHSSVALVAHVRARRAITLQHGQQLAVGQLLRPPPRSGRCGGTTPGTRPSPGTWNTRRPRPVNAQRHARRIGEAFGYLPAAELLLTGWPVPRRASPLPMLSRSGSRSWKSLRRRSPGAAARPRMSGCKPRGARGSRHPL